ncbi:hypothetical protein [Actinoplanes regularis]|uniref:hypothetical protein n=1 Tax=Actinoplanes regularis TaxID=52697 RepID=UPI0011781154|nr:hypothetical protein [Actinoplanes regularis]GIE89746.1 hypothetical protein Are01nite_62260 [Actinoplanes regularis]
MRFAAVSVAVGFVVVIASPLVGWWSNGWFGALSLGGLGTAQVWMALKETLMTIDLGSIRSANRDLDKARRSGSLWRQLVARLRRRLIRQQRRM